MEMKLTPDGSDMFTSPAGGTAPQRTAFEVTNTPQATTLCLKTQKTLAVVATGATPPSYGVERSTSPAGDSAQRLPASEDKETTRCLPTMRRPRITTCYEEYRNILQGRRQEELCCSVTYSSVQITWLRGTSAPVFRLRCPNISQAGTRMLRRYSI